MEVILKRGRKPGLTIPVKERAGHAPPKKVAPARPYKMIFYSLNLPPRPARIILATVAVIFLLNPFSAFSVLCVQW